jgi:hypothetical protein
MAGPLKAKSEQSSVPANFLGRLQETSEQEDLQEMMLEFLSPANLKAGGTTKTINPYGNNNFLDHCSASALSFECSQQYFPVSCSA